MKRKKTYPFLSLEFVKPWIIIWLLLIAAHLHSQTVDVDSVPVQKLMYIPAVDTVFTTVRNLSGNSSLTYTVSVEYKRFQQNVQMQDSLQLEESPNLTGNKHIQYVDTAFLSTAYGSGKKLSSLTVGTKFKAGTKGFNLSDVGTWFIPENTTAGTIYVEIRAGGNSIQDAVVVGKGAANYKIEENAKNGHLYNIRLEEEIPFYPDEDFYVIFTYPAGISRPQGCAVNQAIDSVEGRYWVEQDGVFLDLQHIEGYGHGAWLMYVSEKSAKNIGWMEIINNNKVTIGPKSNRNVTFQLNGLIAASGSQYADIVIQSNDTVHPEVRIPVHLRLNEAPYFTDAVSDINIEEGSVLKISIKVKDYENDKYSILPVAGCKFVQFAVNDSALVLNISPQKGDFGDYIVKYVAIDEYNAVRELKITIHVIENQAPVFIDPPSEIVMEENGVLEIQIAAYDIEKDDFEIHLIGEYSFIHWSFENPAIKLYFSPKEGDSGFYNIKLEAIDILGSVRELTIPVRISLKNRPPVYIGNGEPFKFSFMDGPEKININDYFVDLDGDDFTFEIFCHNSNIVGVSIGKDGNFTLTPKSVGSTVLDFTLKDVRGEQAQYSINVIVGACEDASGIIIQKWNKVLMVNNILGEYASNGYQWYQNGQPIKNATSQYYSSEDDTGNLLDFNTPYFVRIVKLNGDTIYTCPCLFQQTAAPSLKAYPNPVASGSNLYIESDSANQDSGFVEVIDLSGYVKKTEKINKPAATVQMPVNPGLYIVKVIWGDKRGTFRIWVK